LKRISLRSIGQFARLSIYRLSLLLGIFSVIEVFVYSTDGTNPNTRIPLEWYVPALVAFGAVMFGIAWLTYMPARPPDEHTAPVSPERKDRAE
jgi:hypothetical protein